MTKIDIFSGFLGAGKTTLIRQMLHSSYQNEKVVIIENEAGKLNLDASELSGASFSVQKLTSGCVCCTFFKIRFKFQYCSDFQFRHRKYICPCAVLRYCISDFLSCCIGIDCFQTSVFQLHTLCRIYSQFNCIACVCFHMV